MEQKKRPTIAIFIGDTYTEHANEMINGFYSCAKKENINIVFLVRYSLPHDTNEVLSDMTGEDFQIHFSSVYDYLPLFKPDALILVYGSLSIFPDTPDMETLCNYYKGIPCLMIKSVSDNPDIPYLAADNYAGMCSCIQHLISEHGYRKIAFLSGPTTNQDANDRLRAYYDTMQKNGLPVSDTMVAYGDYSEAVDAQVNYLLDSNPGLEAIAFANDSMAKTGYRICNERELVVGRDLAITGFDDVSFAKTMDPPLTSVMHNSFLYSYYALQNAIRLANGQKVAKQTMPTILFPRSSCGCKHTFTEASFTHSTEDTLLSYVNSNIEVLVDNFYISYPYEEEKKQFKELVECFIFDIVENIIKKGVTNYDFRSSLPTLKKLLQYSHIAPMLVLNQLIRLLRTLLPCASDATTENSLLQIISSTQQYGLAMEMDARRFDAQNNLHRNWFTNAFTQNLMLSDLSLEENLMHIMNRLKLMNIKSCYFFLRSEPAVYESSYRLQTPDDVYLTAYFNDDITIHLSEAERIHLNGETGICQILPQEKLHLLSTYVLFSGKTQYGFLLCEHAPTDIAFMSTCCLQIGSYLRYYYLNANEHKIMKELEESINLIKDQNRILNFISEYDELTNLLNRRGFMEKTLQSMHKNIGKTAYILYADLDHLKEINDLFGHSSGDFSLRMVADYLRSSLPKDAIIARIGGDEYAAFIVSDVEDFEQLTRQTLKKHSEEYNQTSNKPYYIEMSVGISKCICSQSVSITDLLDQSDSLLYVEKTHRRSHARKEIMNP